MSIMPIDHDPFTISASVGNNLINKLEDIRKLKDKLTTLDYLQDDEKNDYLTRGLENTIKIFQSDNKLRVDGRLFPAGETERTLNEQLRKKSISAPRLYHNIVAEDQSNPLGASSLGGFGQPAKNVDATGRRIREKPISNKVTKSNKKNSDTKHDIDSLLPRIIREEGGYTDGKNDRRGETNIGINSDTLREYKNWKNMRKEKLPDNFTQDITNVSPELARQIYDEMYYKRYNIDQIDNVIIAEQLLDSAINHGPSNPTRWLQESLNEELDENIEVDGIIGKATRAAIKKAEKQGLIVEINNDMVDKRKVYYHKIFKGDPSQKEFLDGWLDRADEYKIAPKPVKKPNLQK